MTAARAATVFISDDNNKCRPDSLNLFRQQAGLLSWHGERFSPKQMAYL
jgi:hypothetical protein